MSIEILEQLIHSQRFGSINNSTAELKETDIQSKLKSIIISKIPEGFIIIKADGFQLNTIFGENKDYIKRCDFVLFSNDTIYFIELKSHENAPKIKMKDVKNQFKTVECIIDLIDKVIERFTGNEFRLNNLNKKFFLFYHNPNIAKLRTSLKGQYVGFKPNTSDKFHSIAVVDGETINFKEL